jgi:hypothetical protein
MAIIYFGAMVSYCAIFATDYATNKSIIFGLFFHSLIRTRSSPCRWFAIAYGNPGVTAH